jgi:hypothetical protein
LWCPTRSCRPLQRKARDGNAAAGHRCQGRSSPTRHCPSTGFSRCSRKVPAYPYTDPSSGCTTSKLMWMVSLHASSARSTARTSADNQRGNRNHRLSSRTSIASVVIRITSGGWNCTCHTTCMLPRGPSHSTTRPRRLSYAMVASNRRNLGNRNVRRQCWQARLSRPRSAVTHMVPDASSSQRVGPNGLRV